MVKTLTILHEDDALIVVAKPAGLATANVPAGEESVFTVVRRMLAGRIAGGGRRKQPGASGSDDFLGVVSRLDKPVSGVVVFAKTRPAAAAIAGQFRLRSVGKTYVAVVEGRFPAALGEWVTWRESIARTDEPVDRRAGRGRRQASVVTSTAERDMARGTDGLAEGDSGMAELRARVVKRAGEVSLVELAPLTGRRHQLRGQLAARGCPIVGDRMYGARLPFPAGIALHARELVLEHPSTRRPLRIEADLPASWRSRFASLVAAVPPTGRER